MAMRCDFNTYLEEAIRDQLVCGLHSRATQKRLLSESGLTFTRAVELAQNMEVKPKVLRLSRALQI